jgi:hypothetical protein
LNAAPYNDILARKERDYTIGYCARAHAGGPTARSSIATTGLCARGEAAAAPQIISMKSLPSPSQHRENRAKDWNDYTKETPAAE